MNNNLPELAYELEKNTKIYTSARLDLLLILAFTVVNVFLTLISADTYFLFSAYIPYYIVLISMYLCGKMPADWYEGATDIEFFPSIVFYVALVIAVACIAFYLLSYIFSAKNKYGWMITALAFFSVDTIFLLIMFDPAFIVDLIFHGIVIFFLARGIVAGRRLKALPSPEELAAAIETANAEVAAAQAAAFAAATATAEAPAAPAEQAAQDDTPASE